VLVTQPAHGTLTLQPNGLFTYTPHANFNGSDPFTYRAHDGTTNSIPVTVTIVVHAVNDRPTARGIEAVALQNTSRCWSFGELLTSATDKEGDQLTLLSTGERSIQGGVWRSIRPTRS